jgi:deoxyribodipyrimidine photo-lyase
MTTIRSPMNRYACYAAPEYCYWKMAKHTAIVWFQQDLRLADHAALIRAVESGARVVPLFILETGDGSLWAPGAASRAWLHHSLVALADSLEQRGNRLILRKGNSLEILDTIVQETGADAVYAHNQYQPASRQRDEQIADSLSKQQVGFIRLNGSLLSPPGALMTRDGSPYRVFTPFWKAFLRDYVIDEPQPAPARIPAFRSALQSLTVDELDLRPSHPWGEELMQHWQTGEPAAQKLLGTLDAELIANYPDHRDLPATPGTTGLSPYLHFGELGPRQVAARLEQLRHSCRSPGVSTGAETVLRQLVWRDFAHHILFHFPETASAPMNRRFESFPWRHDQQLLHAWQRGKTGIPIVDAGMRELWRTGWMHNRVRLICASLLTKNMRIHWLEGATWFWDTLVDADLPQNSMNWQWVAGSGVDAAPYFRIFNPVTQGEKFDPEGVYVRRWLPELGRLPNKWIHKPWQAPRDILETGGVSLGEHYPLPVVDLKTSREDALAMYKKYVAGPAHAVQQTVA